MWNRPPIGGGSVVGGPYPPSLAPYLGMLERGGQYFTKNFSQNFPKNLVNG